MSDAEMSALCASDLSAAIEAAQTLEDALIDRMLPSSVDDDRNVILEVRAGMCAYASHQYTA